VEGPPSSERSATIRCGDDRDIAGMASEWMVNGKINESVKVNVNADRLEFVHFSLRILTFAYH
jgi:hypothetical protein